MAQTTFSAGTVITSAWANDVDQKVYGGKAAASSVASIAALKLLDKTTITRSFVQGYYAAGDGGGGMYWYDSTDTTTTDNGGSVIVANDGGRWKLVKNGMVSVKQFGAKGDGSTTDLTAIQNCYAAFSTAFWPNGTYTLGNNTWTPPSTFEIYGETRKGVKLTRSGSGPIITLAYGTFDSHIEKIYFTGSGNTGITVAGTAGALQGYCIRQTLQECDFAYELSYGINADLIYARIEKCAFGYEGTVGGKPAPGTSTMCGIRSVVYPSTTNYTNLNIIRDSIFNCGGLTSGALQLTGGDVWKIEETDMSFGGVAVDFADIGELEFDHCWFEGNVSTNNIVKLDSSSVVFSTLFRNCKWTNNTVTNNRLIQWASSIPNKIQIEKNNFDLAATCYILYDNSTTLNTLDGAGNITFWDNKVNGGPAGNKLRTWTDFRGGLTTRFSMIVDTTTPTIISCSDPNAVVGKNATGDVTISSISNPLASANNKVNVQVTPQAPTESRCTTITTTSMRVQTYNSTGVGADGIVSVIASGS